MRKDVSLHMEISASERMVNINKAVKNKRKKKLKKPKAKQTTKKGQNKHDKLLSYFCEAGEAREAGQYLVKYQVLRKENTRLRK